MLIRELPPLRQSTILETPSGKRYRWAEDEPHPANVSFGERCSDTMPGGFETKDTTLARDPGVDYSDLERLSTVTDYDASGNIIWQGRLERAPRSSGDQIAITPSAAGWQAHLEDDQSATAVVIERGHGPWKGMARQRQVNLAGAYKPVTDGHQVPDASTGEPAIKLETSGLIEGASGGISETIYDAGPGNLIGAVHFEASDLQNIASGGATWFFELHSADTDVGPFTLQAGDYDDSPVAFTREQITPPARFAQFRNGFAGTFTGDENERWRMVKHIAVIGDHGLPLQELGAGQDGFLASDIVRYAVQRWAPRLTVTADSVQPSSFVIPQFAPTEPTTAAEFVRQATRYGLQDWAVWDDLVFWWHARSYRGRSWRARVGPARLEETGPQVDRLWESVIVSYRDVDGSTRTVGPPGSGADVESAELRDSDPENPANKAGITRRTKLDMGIGTPASATEVGHRFLTEQKQLDSSGRAVLVGHVMDDRGVLHPYTRPRAGDTITFTDAADPSPRRIVRTEKTRASRSCSIDLDSPPEGMAALLERLGVVLTPLGL
jgi:hypothetical protein